MLIIASYIFIGNIYITIRAYKGLRNDRQAGLMKLPQELLKNRPLQGNYGVFVEFFNGKQPG